MRWFSFVLSLRPLQIPSTKISSPYSILACPPSFSRKRKPTTISGQCSPLPPLFVFMFYSDPSVCVYFYFLLFSDRFVKYFPTRLRIPVRPICVFRYLFIYLFSDPFVKYFILTLFVCFILFLFCLPPFRFDSYYSLSPSTAVFASFPCRPTALLDPAVIFWCSACLSVLFDYARFFCRSTCRLCCAVLCFILFLFCLPPFRSDSYFHLSPARCLIAIFALFPCCPPALLNPCHLLPLRLPVCAVRLCPFLLALLMLCIVLHRIVC